MAGGRRPGRSLPALLSACKRPAPRPWISLFLPGEQPPGPAWSCVARSWPTACRDSWWSCSALLPVTCERLGRPLGALLALILVGSVVLLPLDPGRAAAAGGSSPPWLRASCRCCSSSSIDLLTALLAGCVAQALLFGWPLMPRPDDPTLQVHGWLPLALVAAPLLVSLRALGSGREFVYRYEDVPPHVRRIAERERQRVELETARRIQSSILPELPPRLHGVEIAHAYLPASEVGRRLLRRAGAGGRPARRGRGGRGRARRLERPGDVHGQVGARRAGDLRSGRGARSSRPQPDGLPDRPQAAAGHALLRAARPAAARDGLRERRPPLPLPGDAARARWRRWSRWPIRSGCAATWRWSPAPPALDPGDTLFLFSDGLVEARPEGLGRALRLRAPGAEPRPPRPPGRRGPARRRPRRRGPFHRPRSRARTTRRFWCCGCRRGSAPGSSPASGTFAIFIPEPPLRGLQHTAGAGIYQGEPGSAGLRSTWTSCAGM